MIVKAVNVKCQKEFLADQAVIKVVKANKLMEFDENTYVKIADSVFHNGIIEVKMLSRLLADAPDFARGFIGIAFRISEDDSSFESFYVRPTNGQSSDPIRKHRAIQYFSYPKYTFDYFREKGITGYEGSADIELNEWINLKVIVTDERAEFFVNGQQVLLVDQLKHLDSQGQVGLFVDIGTEGYFKDLYITYFD
ncbi:hypothetical protein [Enterococcus bulliens]